jgi:hypothetical protein
VEVYMKSKRYISLSVILICLVPLFSIGYPSAGNASPEQKPKPGLYILSKTDTTSVTDTELVSVYREADASLMDQIRDRMESLGLRADIVRSEQEIAADPARFVLLVTLEKIELGAKRPFGRTAKVKVTYTLQNRDRSDIVKRSHEETSVNKWQNCIKKISQQTAEDVAHDIEKKSASDKGADKPEKSKPAPADSSAEARLKELENLKAKGLITQDEYEAKRKEILKQL